MRIGIRGGATPRPPEERQIPVSPECETSVAHTQKVAEGAKFTRFKGAKIQPTKPPQVAAKVNKTIFRA